MKAKKRIRLTPLPPHYPEDARDTEGAMHRGILQGELTDLDRRIIQVYERNESRDETANVLEIRESRVRTALKRLDRVMHQIAARRGAAV